MHGWWMENTIHKDPTVSVIIPAYNMPNYLNQAVESVCSQTFTDYELIVVDDASSDEVVSQYKLPPNARLIRRKERFGAAAATRNTGLKEARGKYVAFLDQDDIWFPDKLSMQVEALEHSPHASLVFCHYILVNELLEPLEKQDKPVDAISDSFLQIIDHCFIRTPSTVLVKRDVLDACGLFDEQIMGASDWDLYIRIARDHKFIVIPDSLVQYRMHQDQLHHQNKMMNEAMIQIMQKTYAWALKERPALAGTVRRCYCRYLWQVGKDFLRTDGDRRTALGYLYRSASVWPYDWKTYRYMFLAWMSIGTKQHRKGISSAGKTV